MWSRSWKPRSDDGFEFADGNMTTRNGSGIGYTSYNLPNLIMSGSNSSTLSYGAHRNRYKQVSVASGVTDTTIYVGGSWRRSPLRSDRLQRGRLGVRTPREDFGRPTRTRRPEVPDGLASLSSPAARAISLTVMSTISLCLAS